MALSQGGLFVVQFGSSVVLARLLSPYETGIFALALAMVGLLSILRALGLSAYLVRSTETTDEMIASVFTTNAVIALFLSACILGLGTLGGRLLGDEGVQRALLGMSVLPVLGIFEFLPATMIERAGNFRVIGMLGIARTLTGNGLTLVLAYAGFSYMSLVYGQIAAAVVSVIGFNALGWRHARLRIGFSDGRAIMRYAFQMVGISGVTILAARVSELALGRLQGVDTLGLYSRASGLSGSLWDSVHLVIARILFVEFSNRKRDGYSLREPYLRAVQLMTALLWPAFLGLAVLAGPIIRLLYGDVWLGAAPPLSLLCLAAAILVAITLTWEVFNVSQETGRQARIEFVRAGVGLVLFSGGCLVGMTAAAGARVLEACFSVVLYRPHLDRMTETGWRDLVPIYGQSGLVTLFAILPAAGLMAAHGWSPAVPLAWVAGSIVTGMAAWVAGLVLLRHPLFQEVQRLAAMRRG